MKKMLTITTICFMLVVLFVGCGKAEKEQQEEQLAKNDTYFNIANEIKSGDCEKALSDLVSAYGSVAYSDKPEGFNKMNLYRSYYDKMEMYDKEMDVLLEFLKANDFEYVLISYSEKISDENSDIAFAIYMVEDIMNKVSADKKEEALKTIGQDKFDLVNKLYDK